VALHPASSLLLKISVIRVKGPLVLIRVYNGAYRHEIWGHVGGQFGAYSSRLPVG